MTRLLSGCPYRQRFLYMWRNCSAVFGRTGLRHRWLRYTDALMKRYWVMAYCTLISYFKAKICTKLLNECLTDRAWCWNRKWRVARRRAWRFRFLLRNGFWHAWTITIDPKPLKEDGFLKRDSSELRKHSKAKSGFMTNESKNRFSVVKDSNVMCHLMWCAHAWLHEEQLRSAVLLHPPPLKTVLSPLSTLSYPVPMMPLPLSGLECAGSDADHFDNPYTPRLRVTN